MSAKRWTAAAAALLLAAGAGPTAGQSVVTGFPRVNQSDVTGPSVTSGDLVNGLFGEPGTVQSINCSGAWGLLSEGRVLRAELDSLSLARAVGGRAASPAAQRDVGVLLAGGPGADGAGARVLAALTAANPRARTEAAVLVEVTGGLLATVARIDPLKPRRAAPTQLHRAIGAWDALVDASDSAFLAAPPDEFLALRAVLGRLDGAAIVNAARVGDHRQVDEYGAACAPAPPAPAVEAPLAVELEFGVCVLADGDFRDVRGVYLPATGDSLVTVDGERRPLRQAYPDSAGHAVGRGWFTRDTPIRVFGRDYLQWGMSRVVRPGELEPADAYRGVTVFIARDDPTPPDVVFVAFRAGCEVQPYRRVQESHRVRGG